MVGFPTVAFPTVGTRHIEMCHVRFAVLNAHTLEPKFQDAAQVYKLLDSELFKHLRIANINVKYDVNVISSRIETALKQVGLTCTIEADVLDKEVEYCKVHCMKHKTPFDVYGLRPVSLTCKKASELASAISFRDEVDAYDIESDFIGKKTNA